MKFAHLSEMTGGWFVGDFQPSVLGTSAFEAGIKKYKAGDIDAKHFHKIATEITVIISGRAEMAGREVSEGDIIVVEPNDIIQFKALTDVALAVIKTPSVKNDKYVE
ncbi:hypothetical protein ACLBXO_30465 [Methylobacterium sp. C33D]